jgi:hypothetical protein
MTSQPQTSPRLVDAALTVSGFIERHLIVPRASFGGEEIPCSTYKNITRAMKELVAATEEVFQEITESEGGSHD